MRTTTLRLFFGLSLFFVGGGRLAGIAPAFVSDEDLAAYPVVVLAKWERWPVRANHRYEQQKDEKVITAVESFTDLNVLRVIKGGIKPGIHSLKIDPGIAWSTEGKRISSGTSTEIPGEVDDVTQPNVWFLQRTRSWDTKDQREYLTIGHYRAVQPLSLEQYFAVLGSANPDANISKLLTSTHTEVAQRSLLFLCGGVHPWPYDSAFEKTYLGRRKQGRMLRDHAGTVVEVMTQNDKGQVRVLAAAVYAQLAGTNGVRLIRGLLKDDDSDVRACAVALLARYRDVASLDLILQTVSGDEKGWLACRIIEAMSAWGDTRLVPALVRFLENQELAYRYGDDVGIPALKAREALNAITGHSFPFNVESSLEAWKEVGQLESRELRQHLLTRILASDPSPLKAEVIGDGGTNAVSKIINKSQQDVVVTRSPASVEQRWRRGSSEIGLMRARGKDDFITLRPGESVQFGVQLHKGFLLDDPESRHLILRYSHTGREWAMHAWIGAIEAEFGADWKGQRKVEHVEEKWQNGNLKAKGQTMNGENYGEWHYFNEAGDRIKVVDYSGGHGTAICNPDHPENKGAGKQRRAK